jgi:hypothetical protein
VPPPRVGRVSARRRPARDAAGRQGGGRRPLDLGSGRARAAGQCTGQQAWSATRRRQQEPRYPAASREPAMAGLHEPRRVPRRLECATQRPVAERVLWLDGGGLDCWCGLAVREASRRPFRSTTASDGTAGQDAGSQPKRAASTTGDRRGQGPHELPRPDDPAARGLDALAARGAAALGSAGGRARAALLRVGSGRLVSGTACHTGRLGLTLWASGCTTHWGRAIEPLGGPSEAAVRP